MHEADVRVHYAALQVALVKAGMVDASQALWEWAAEWLDYDEEDQALLEQELDLDGT